MKKTTFALVLFAAGLGYAASPATQPAPSTQIQRLLEATQSNFKAYQAMEAKDWDTAKKDCDVTAKLLQDAVVTEANKDQLAKAN